MNTAHKVTTYEPDNCLKKGYLAIFREIYTEFAHNRWLIFQLFKRDITALYKQSFIGILWAFILPIITVGTFILLNRSGIFNIGDISVPYPIYAVLGLAFWQLFSAGLIASSNSLVLAGPMITKINFSKKSLVVASTGQALVSFGVQFSLVLVLFLYFGVAPSIAILLFPVLIVPLLLLTLGLGLVLSLLNGIYRDVMSVLPVAVTFLLFLTPILYAMPSSGAIATIATYNPIYYLVSGARSLILTGAMAEPTGFAISAFISLLVFIVCLLVFHLTETRVTERL